jgi:hypothetical protein
MLLWFIISQTRNHIAAQIFIFIKAREMCSFKYEISFWNEHFMIS